MGVRKLLQQLRALCVFLCVVDIATFIGKQGTVKNDFFTVLNACTVCFGAVKAPAGRIVSTCFAVFIFTTLFTHYKQEQAGVRQLVLVVMNTQVISSGADEGT